MRIMTRSRRKNSRGLIFAARPRLAWLAAVMVACAALPASAQTTTWTGGSNVTWSTLGNWSNGLPSTSVTAVFAGTTSTQPTDTSAGANLGLIQFNSGAGAYTLGNGTSSGNFFFTDGGGITVNAGVTTNQRIWTWLRPLATSGTGTVAITNNGTGLLDLNVFTSALASGTNTLSILSVGGSGTTQFAQVLESTNTNVTSVVKNGSGTLIILSSANVASGASTTGYFSGSTTINGGTLQLGDSTALGSGTGSIVFGGGTLRYSGSNTVDYSSRIRSGTSAISIDTAGQSVTFSSALAASNTGGLAKLGSGTLTLSAANTYSGSTSITGGVLNIRNATALGNTAAGTTVSSGASLQLQGGITVSGESLSIAGGGISNDGALRNISGTNTWTGAIAADGVAAVAASGDQTVWNRVASDAGLLTLSGPIQIAAPAASGSGAGMLVLGNGNVVISGNISGGKAGNASVTSSGVGTGTRTLSGSNSYLGWTGFNGSITVEGGFAIPDASRVISTSTNGRLVLNASETIGGLASSAASQINLNSHTLTIGADNTTPLASDFGGATYLGTIIGTGGIVKVGTGVLTLAASNSYSGGTTLNAGVLSFANNALGTSGAVRLNGGTLQWATGNTQDISGRLTLVSGSTATLDTNGNNVTLATGFGGSTTAALTKVGSGTLTLSGAVANTYTGMTSVTAGSLLLDKTAGVNAVGGNVTINGGGLRFNADNQIADAATVAMTGSASLLNYDDTTGLPFRHHVETIANLLVDGGRFASGAFGSNWNITTSGALTGGAGQTTFIINSGGIMRFGGLSLTAMTGSAEATPNGVTVFGNSASGQTAVTVGAGGLTLDGSRVNLFGGFSVAGALGSRLVLDGDVTTIGTATSTIGRGTFASGTGNGAGQVTVELSSTAGSVNRSFTIGGGGANLDVLVPITNGSATTAGIRKIGSGILTLGTANTYNGATTIAAGTLALGVNGSFANSPTITIGDAGSSGAVLDISAKTGTFTFSGGQTVGGIGTINIGAGKAVSSAGIWAPGNSIGSNSVTGNLSLSGTSQFELGTPGTSTSAPGTSDFTAVSGTLTLGGALTLLDNAGANGNGSAAGGVYRLFTYGNAVSGSYTSVTAPTAATRTSLSQITYGGSGTAAGQGVFLSLYNLASATSAQTVNLGNTRVGTALTGSVTLTNSAAANATYTETLSTGNFSSTTTGFTTSGSASNIAGGGSGSGNLLVGLGTGLTAGAQSGTTTLALFSNAVNSSGLAQQSIASQTITITGTVWNYAAANIASGTTVSFGTVLKGTSLSQALSISNTAPNDGFSEKLGAAFGSATGQAGGSGSWSLLSAGGTSTALSVYLASGSAGTASGSQTLNFTSDGAGTSGLTAASIGSQTVNLTATVLDPAVASFMSGSTATTSLTLNFGSVNQNASVSPLNFDLYNLLQTAGFTADLALQSITPGGGNSGALTTNLELFNTLASGTFNSWQALVNTSNQGTFSNTWTLQFRSSNGGTVYANDAPQTLTLTTSVIIVPEPGAIALAGIGIAAAAWAFRRRK